MSCCKRCGGLGSLTIQPDSPLCPECQGYGVPLEEAEPTRFVMMRRADGRPIACEAWEKLAEVLPTHVPMPGGGE